MKHTYSIKNTNMTEGMRIFIEKKFEKLEKRLPEDAEIISKMEFNPGTNKFKVEIATRFCGDVLRAEAKEYDMYDAIQKATLTMVRLIDKKKDMTEHKRRRVERANIEEERTDLEYKIEKCKTHSLDVMTAEQACEAMEMSDHAFYAYWDTEKDAMCIVYKRDNNTFGHIAYHQA